MNAFTSNYLKQQILATPGSDASARSPDSQDDSARQEAVRRDALAESLAGQSPRRAYSPVVLAGIVRLVEFALLATTGFVVYDLHVVREMSIEYLVAIPSIAVFAVIVFQALDINTIGAFRDPLFQCLRIAGGWTFVFLVALAATFFFKHDFVFSRVWMLGWYLVGFGLLACERIALSVLVRRMTASGSLERRTVVVGGGANGEQILRELASQKHTDIRICGVFDDRTDERSPDVVAGFPRLGAVDDLVEFARRTRIDLIIFTLPITAEERLLQMLRKLWVLPIDIRLAAHSNKLRFRPRSYSYAGNVPLYGLAICWKKPIFTRSCTFARTSRRSPGRSVSRPVTFCR